MALSQNSTPEEILLLIRSLAENQVPLTLTNSYKGVMVTQECKIIELDRESGAFLACHKNLWANIGQFVFIHSPGVKGTVRARIRRIHPVSGQVTLDDFGHFPDPWVHRIHERVEPSSQARADLKLRKRVHSVSLVNLSVEGVGVYLCGPVEEKYMPQLDDPVTLKFSLAPLENLELALRGAIVGIRPTGYPQMLNLGVRIYPRPEQALLLEHYIEKRKADILSEIQQVFFHLQEPRQTHDLYF